MTRRYSAAVVLTVVLLPSANAFCCRGVRRSHQAAITTPDVSSSLMATTGISSTPSMFLPRAASESVLSGSTGSIKTNNSKWPPAAQLENDDDTKRKLGFELKLSVMPSAPGGSDSLEDGENGQRREPQPRRQRRLARRTTPTPSREPLTISPAEYLRIPALKQWIPSLRELENKSQEDLEEMCILRGLKKDGTTEELQDRLRKWIMQQRSSSSTKTKSISESFLFPETGTVRPKQTTSGSTSTTAPASSSIASDDTPTTEVPDSLQAWRRSKAVQQPDEKSSTDGDDTSVKDWNEAWAQRFVEERHKHRSDMLGKFRKEEEFDEDIDDDIVDDGIEPMCEMEALTKTEEILERGEEIDRMLAEDMEQDDDEDEDDRYEAWAKIREEQLLRRSEDLMADYGIDLFEDDNEASNEDLVESSELPVVSATTTETTTTATKDELLSATWEELYDYGRLEHASGNVAKATRLFKAGLKLDPSNSNLHLALGDVYRGAMFYQMAQMSYHRALKYAQNDDDYQEKQSIEAMTGLAYVAYEKRKEEECRHYLKMAALASTPNSPQPWMTWARFEESQGNLDTAKSIIATAMESLTPPTKSDDDDVQQQQQEWIAFLDNRLRLESATAAAANDDDDPSSSIDAVFRQTVALFPQQWTFYDALASHCHERGETSRAQELYRMAIELSRTHNDGAIATNTAIRHYAQDEMMEGNYENALAILSSVTTEAVSTTSNSDGLQELYYVQAVCEWHLGDTNQAKEMFEIAAAIPSSLSSTIYFGRASLEVARGNLILAQHFLGLAWKESSNTKKKTADHHQHRFNIWKLWKRVAIQLEQPKLVDECQRQIDRLRQDTASTVDLVESVLQALPLWSDDKSNALPRIRSDVSEVLTPVSYLEQDPWADQLALSSKHSIGSTRLPSLPALVQVAEEEGMGATPSLQLEGAIKNGGSSTY